MFVLLFLFDLLVINVVVLVYDFDITIDHGFGITQETLR